MSSDCRPRPTHPRRSVAYAPAWRQLARALLLAATLPALQAAELTAREQRWLRSAEPVLAQARQLQLPLDIVVQPQDTPGAAPLSLGFVAGRCKLVLSLRGNPQAEATLARLPAGLEGPALELMAAHELGHCHRYLEGAWHALPAGFEAEAPDHLAPPLRAAFVDMRAARREEAYGDLVGLAWIERRHAAHYPVLHAWLLAERSRDRVPGTHHDTLSWLKLATAGVARAEPVGTARGEAADDSFRAAAALWTQGLLQDED